MSFWLIEKRKLLCDLYSKEELDAMTDDELELAKTPKDSSFDAKFVVPGELYRQLFQYQKTGIFNHYFLSWKLFVGCGNCISKRLAVSLEMKWYMIDLCDLNVRD